MTKSQESGENEITRAARQQAKQRGIDVCTILAEMLVEAKAANDTEQIVKIIKAQKYLGCRNIRKRGRS